MKPRVRRMYRVRLAVLAKSSNTALSVEDGQKIFTSLVPVYNSTVDLYKVVQEAARTGEPPSQVPRGWDGLVSLAIRTRDADKVLSGYTAQALSVPLIQRAGGLARWLIQFAEIPPGQAKAFEQAAKPVMSAKRAPNKFATWAKNNLEKVAYLIKAFNTWPLKTEKSEDTYPIGPLTIHNTLQLQGSDLEKTDKVIEAAVKFVKGSGIPNVAKALYGDVFLVGKLQGHNTLAWYSIRDDNIYLRPLLKADLDATHSLCHEIGHRYWFKVMDNEARAWWRNYHDSKRFEAPDVTEQVREVVRSIKPGMPLPIEVKGWSKGGPPIVTEVVDLGPTSMVSFTNTRGAKKGQIGKLRMTDIIQYLAKLNTRSLSYPTAYAATSPEEHFADAFAMYAMGKLTGPHKENFERLIVNRKP